MKFRDLLEQEMSIEDFIKSVETNFYKHFPNGYIDIKFKTNITDAIVGTFGMIGDIKDNINGIAENDKMKHSFIMYPIDKDKTIWSFKASTSKIYINPLEGSYNAMDSIQTKMGNNSKITLDKANQKLSKFFKKLSSIMQDNKDEIFGVKDIKPKYLIFK